MLREIRPLADLPGARRRWFADTAMDLILWYEPEAEGGEKLAGFDLCYDKAGKEHAFSWTADGQSLHRRVDAGEPAPGGAKQSPILLPDGVFPRARVREEFCRRSAGIPSEVRATVLAALDSAAANKAGEA